MRKSRFVPSGRLQDLADEPDAYLLAYSIPVGMWQDYKITRYNSREALRRFCRDGSAHHALIKDQVPPGMMTNRNTQREVRQ